MQDDVTVGYGVLVATTLSEQTSLGRGVQHNSMKNKRKFVTLCFKFRERPGFIK